MFISYLVLRILTFPLSFLPYKTIHFLGKCFGWVAYYTFPKFRKRALSNLALSNLRLSNKDIKKTALSSIQSLMITCLEYPKLSRETNISRIAYCQNKEEADAIISKGKGVIFFCGHQANWELLFLEGTSRMMGMAIGRPIKNPYLYKWVQNIRQKFGGKILTPKNALKEGIKGLKKGAFLGIVGDQGMPDSGFSSPFLGRIAYTSPAPAILSYKTNTPIIMATTKREKGKYEIHYSKAIYPNLETPMEKEIPRLMHAILSLQEKSIRERPSEWLWIHNRWKQQTTHVLKRTYRQDSIAVFLPEKEALLQELPILRSLYPTEHITLFAPKSFANKIPLQAELHFYKYLQETLHQDFRFKLIFNFTESKMIKRHYKKWATQIFVHPTSFTALEILVKND